MKNWTIFLVAVLMVTTCYSQIKQPVRIDSGLVSGAPGRDPSIIAFKGIPYAEPPVGALRWAEPRTPRHWEGIRKADHFSDGCVDQHAALQWVHRNIAAVALKLAEETNALVLPNLQFTYPGDGMIGRGTVQVSSAQAIAYLRPIARSLLRQGFKRQIYITVGNAAGPETVSPLALEFFYETRTPALYLEGDILLQRVKADLNKVFFGAYSILGRLDDIPVNLTPEVPKHAIDQGLRTLQALRVSGGARNGTVGFFGFEDESGAPVQAVTDEQRAAWAKEGSEAIDAAVKIADINRIAQSLRDHDPFTREYLIPKFNDLLP